MTDVVIYFVMKVSESSEVTFTTEEIFRQGLGRRIFNFGKEDHTVSLNLHVYLFYVLQPSRTFRLKTRSVLLTDLGE